MDMKGRKYLLRLAAVFLSAALMSAWAPALREASAGLPSTSYNTSFGSNATSYVSAGRTSVTVAEISLSDGLEYLRVTVNVTVSCSYTSGMSEVVNDYIYVYGVTSGGSEVYLGYVVGSFWRTPQGSFGGTVTVPSGYSRLRMRAFWDSPCMAGSYCPTTWDLTGSTAAVGGYSSTTGEVQQATSAAQQANTAAQQAKTSADQAKSSADAALSAVNNANGNTVTAVRDASGTVLFEARQANTKLDTIQTSITNMQSTIANDATPPAVKIRTVSGAMATSGGFINAVIEISDNTSTNFLYSLDGITYAPVPPDKVISLPVVTPGPNLIAVYVKDAAGNVGNTSITIRKL